MTTPRSEAPYGAWRSPLSIGDLTGSAAGLGAPRIDRSELYWLESRADQSGRSSVWRRAIAGGEAVEVTPAPAYVRTRVHEYGGGEYDVADGVVVYSELTDGRLRVVRDGMAVAITPEGDYRYADLRLHPDRGLVLAVREDHTQPGEPVNTVVRLDLDGPNPFGGTVLLEGADFYSTPELSAANRLAWTEWDHPNMPWDSTTIKVGTLLDSRVADVEVVAGGPQESAVQPRWLDEQRLVFVSDRTGWWNLYAWSGGSAQPLCVTEAEFCGPQWTLGMSPYAVIDPDHLLCTLNRSGAESVALLTMSTGELLAMAPTGTSAATVTVGSGVAAAVLNYPDRPAELCLLDLAEHAWTSVRSSSTATLDAGSVSLAQPVSWTSELGPVHGWFYPPANASFVAPPGTRPPLITLSHGGPTAFAAPSLRLAHQFWTTRGYALLDVNYGGSSGFGRAYRDRLGGSWGVVDVADCAAGATAMAARGFADPHRLAIKGGSAGGYTTLRALTATTAFQAGISQYGVGDLEALARDTHKFEARYLDRLVGPYPADRAIYRDRSPIHHVDDLAAPILLLQGADDRVVPLNQAESMAAAARRKGLPVALLVFPGEGHGFRRADTVRSATEAQQYFLGRLFGFTPADDLAPIPIDNLDSVDAP